MPATTFRMAATSTAITSAPRLSLAELAASRALLWLVRTCPSDNVTIASSQNVRTSSSGTTWAADAGDDGGAPIVSVYSYNGNIVG